LAAFGRLIARGEQTNQQASQQTNGENRNRNENQLAKVGSCNCLPGIYFYSSICGRIVDCALSTNIFAGPATTMAPSWL